MGRAVAGAGPGGAAYAGGGMSDLHAGAACCGLHACMAVLLVMTVLVLQVSFGTCMVLIAIQRYFCRAGYLPWMLD